MSDRSVRVTLSLISTGFEAGMQRAKASTDAMLASVDKQEKAYNTVGNAATVAGAAILAGVGASVKAAMDWQSAFAGVKKTVDGTPEQIAQLEGELRGMAKTMATSHTEIAAVAEAAGQLGVATESVSSFTRTMVMLGESTNLSADAAATSMAQFMNIMGSSPQIVGRLGATLVDLGNKGASTESQIMELSQRLAGAANQVGLTEQATMGFASAIASTGMNVEAGGTAMSKVFLKMQSAVESGGDKLAVLSRVAGTDFATAFEQDAAGATMMFVEGLGRLQASGQSVSGVLGELGMKGQYERDTLMRLAGATKAAGAEQDLLRYNLDNANASFADGSALMNEYAQRAATADSRVKVAWNNIKDAAISFGSAALPVVSSAADGIAGLVAQFAQMPQAAQSTALVGATVAGGLLLAVGGTMKAVSAFANLKSSLSDLNVNFDGAKGKIAAFGRATAIALPVIAAIGITMRAAQADIDRSAMSLDQVADSMANIARQGVGLDGVNQQFSQVMAGAGGVHNNLMTWGYDVNSLGEAWKFMGNATRNSSINVNNFLDAFMPMKTTTGVVRGEFEKMDQSLAQMATSGGLKEAQASFRKLSDEAVAQGESLEFASTYFGKYQGVLAGTAQALGVTTLSATDMANWMRGDIPEAVQAAMAAGGPLVDQLSDVQRSLAQTTTAAQQQAKAFLESAKAAGQAAQSWAGMSGSQMSMEDAIDKATEAVKENGKTLDINTEKGRANKAALDGIVASTGSYVENLAKTGASHAEVDAAWTRGRENFIKTAIAMDSTSSSMEEARRRAEALADEAGLIPDKITVLFDTPGADVSAKQAAELKEAVETIPAIAETTILAKDARPSKAEVDAFVKSVGEVPGLKESQIRTMADLYGVKEAERLLTSIPAEVSAEVLTPGAAQAKSDVQALATVIQGVPGLTEAMVVAPGATLSKAEVDAVNAALMRVPGVTEADLLTPGATLSKRQADDVTAALRNIPGVTTANVSAPGASDSKTRADQVRAALQNIPGMTKATIDTVAHLAGAYEARNAVNAVNSRTVTITTIHRSVNETIYRGGPASSRGTQQAVADGGLFTHAGGNFVRAFASGGISFRGQLPQIRAAGGAGVQWAEEGAGPWEAFISGHPAKRKRSRFILEDVAARLGGYVSWGSRYADGGVHTPRYATSSYRPPITNITTTVAGGSAGLTRADLDYLADRIGASVLAGARQTTYTHARATAAAGRLS